MNDAFARKTLVIQHKAIKGIFKAIGTMSEHVEQTNFQILELVNKMEDFDKRLKKIEGEEHV